MDAKARLDKQRRREARQYQGQRYKLSIPVPFGWRSMCLRLARGSSPGTQSFLLGLADQRSLTIKQWNVFRQIFARKTGRTIQRAAEIATVF